mgnify:CR=1 FL=1
MYEDEVQDEYEANTGEVIVSTLEGRDALRVPAVLVANHGPFTWGEDAHAAVKNSVVLDTVAQMALGALQLNPELDSIPDHLLDRHFLRKHGPTAYYGQ